MASAGFAEGKDDYEYKVRDMSQSTINFGRSELERACPVTVTGFGPECV